MEDSKWVVCYRVKKTQRWEVIEDNDILKDRIYVLNKVMNVDKKDILVVRFTESYKIQEKLWEIIITISFCCPLLSWH